MMECLPYRARPGQPLCWPGRKPARCWGNGNRCRTGRGSAAADLGTGHLGRRARDAVGVPYSAQITMTLWLLRGALVIEASDQPADLPMLRAAGSRSEGGRSLHVVAGLCAQWGHYLLRPRLCAQ
jgi:hypothetical protein